MGSPNLSSSYRRYPENNVVRDPNIMNLDTHVKIVISDIGIFIPECNTTSPLEAYVTVENVINIMNRGIDVEIPDVPYNKGVTTIIENILLIYDSKSKELSSRGAKTADVSVALESIMNINNTKMDNLVKEKQSEMSEKSTIFDVKDLYSNTAKGLSNEFIAEFNKLESIKYGTNSDPRSMLRKAENKHKFDEEKNVTRETIIAMSGLYEKYVNTNEDSSDYNDIELLT